MEPSLTLKKITENMKNGILTADQLESAFSLVKSNKCVVPEIQIFVNEICAHCSFSKEGTSGFLRNEILTCLCNILEIALNKSYMLDLSQIISADISERAEELVGCPNFVFSQVETFLIPLISLIDDSKKIDTNSTKGVLKLSSIIMNKQYATLIRHKKVLRYPLNLLKAILTSPKQLPEDANILQLLLLFFAKYCLTSNSNREYFCLKGGVKLLSHSLKVDKYKNSQNAIYAILALGTAISNETISENPTNSSSVTNRIELWLSGIFTHIITKLLPDSNSPYFSNIPAIQIIFYFLWMALRKNEVSDLQQGVLDLGIVRIISQIIEQNSKKSAEIVSLGIAVIRRLVTLESIESIEKIFINEIENIANLALEEIKPGNSPTSSNKKIYQKFLSKEMMACIGNISAFKESVLVNKISEKYKSQKYIAKSIIINLSTQYMEIPKILKTGLATLSNLAAIEGDFCDYEESFKLAEKVINLSGISNLVHESAFKLLFSICVKPGVLENIYEKGCKKLAFKGLLSPNNSKQTLILAIQILRIIYGKRKEEWSKDKADTKKIILNLIANNKSDINICCESFLLMSVLMEEKDSEDKGILSAIINELMNLYKDKESDLKKLIQSIGHLPVEDINILVFLYKYFNIK